MSRSKKDLVSRISKPFTSARVVANNTLEIQYEDGTKAIRLHDTDVVVFNQDGSVALDSGGYRTKVTKDRVTAPRPEERGFYGFATNALQPQCDSLRVSQSNVPGFTLGTAPSNHLPGVQVSKVQSAHVALSAAVTKIEQVT
jgi:hypothetical protein